jgi:DNA-binding GntR family transcriptional regulator
MDYVNELHLFRRKYFNAPGNMRKSNSEHRAIYEAIASGSTVKAKNMAERHVWSGRQRLLSTLDQQD